MIGNWEIYTPYAGDAGMLLLTIEDVLTTITTIDSEIQVTRVLNARVMTLGDHCISIIGIHMIIIQNLTIWEILIQENTFDYDNSYMYNTDWEVNQYRYDENRTSEYNQSYRHGWNSDLSQRQISDLENSIASAFTNVLKFH